MLFFVVLLAGWVVGALVLGWFVFSEAIWWLTIISTASFIVGTVTLAFGVLGTLESPTDYSEDYSSYPYPVSEPENSKNNSRGYDIWENFVTFLVGLLTSILGFFIVVLFSLALCFVGVREAFKKAKDIVRWVSKKIRSIRS